MADKTYVCGYTHCLHKGEKVSEQDSVIVGKRRFHKDCAQMKEYIDEIKDLYFDYIDKDADYKVVLSVINNMIFKKGIDPEYFLFGLKKWVWKKVKIKSPYSLHYLATNKILLAEWEKVKEEEGL
jgi:hypothetical protein